MNNRWIVPKGIHSIREEFNGPFFHSRDVFVLLSERLCAGVFTGLDSKTESQTTMTHPPKGAVGFLIFRASCGTSLSIC
jgi:hypothetical protein